MKFKQDFRITISKLKKGNDFLAFPHLSNEHIN